MGIIELLLLAVGLSMDAFAVSICKGLSTDQAGIRHMVSAGLWFGGFQMLMPVIGCLLGSAFAGYITAVDHWIAFILLGLIGANMIREALSEEDETSCGEAADEKDAFGFRSMFLMAVATSIDALAVGVTFAFLKVSMVTAIPLIGAVTFCFSAAGIKIGGIFGSRFQAKAGLAGGIILILLGLKILLEHTVGL